MFYLCVVAILPAIALLHTLFCLLKNLNIARNIGLKYVVVPIYNYNTLGLILTRPFFLVIDHIWPNPSPASWRRLCGSAWLWKCRHASFVDLGTDTFLTVAPGGIILYTADADVVAQITDREKDFPKAAQLYKPISIYGDNVVSSTGENWRRHRRLTSAAFSEKNNELVWNETLFQTQKMIAFWIPGGESRGNLVREVAADTMRLSLSVISRAALGQRINLFSGSGENGLIVEHDVPEGHSMTFSDALQGLLDQILTVIIFPRWLLRLLPSRTMQIARQAHDEWGKYMQEMVLEKLAAIKNNTTSDGESVDLIGHFIKTKMAVDTGKASEPKAVILESDIIGNMFVFFVAGHETSANSIHFCLLLLAIHPQIQAEVQLELDQILNNRTLSSLDYKKDYSNLANSLLGAVLAEQLRLITPVISIPKRVGCAPQNLTVEGRVVNIPPQTIVRLAILSVHRNPRFWPSIPRNSTPYFPPSNPENDLEEFRPQRWISKHSDTSEKISGSNTARTNLFYVPPDGAYLPFSSGQRACSGQRFAQVEILCALAAILSLYSVELAVDDLATEADLLTMSEQEKKGVWEKARDRANDVWQQKMRCVLTLQIRGGHVPLRIVRRGHEAFGDMGNGLV